MNTGIFMLGLAYVLSQFFRAFLAVLTPTLGQDIGATPDDLAVASGLWFLAFAIMQIPIGWALDTIGPRRTAAWLLFIGGGGGSAIFALATTTLHVNIAMTLIGIGCAPVLMASYYIFAREYPPAQFAVLASLMVGLGSIGNLVASYPMAFAVDSIGWRAALWGLSGLSALVAMFSSILVRDPPPIKGEVQGSLRALLCLGALWFIFPLMGVNYAFSGAIRGLWIGPYLSDVFAADTGAIGLATLLMGVAMILGTLIYGQLDQKLASRKWMITAGAVLTLLPGCALIVLPDWSFGLSIFLLCVIGFFGASYPVIMAHGRSFLPPHLIGRGVTLLNLFSIGGTGVLQFVSGQVFSTSLKNDGIDTAYVNVFGLFTICLLVGLIIYLFSRDSSVS